MSRLPTQFFMKFSSVVVVVLSTLEIAFCLFRQWSVLVIIYFLLRFVFDKRSNICMATEPRWGAWGSRSFSFSVSDDFMYTASTRPRYLNYSWRGENSRSGFAWYHSFFTHEEVLQLKISGEAKEFVVPIMSRCTAATDHWWEGYEHILLFPIKWPLLFEQQ